MLALAQGYTPLCPAGHLPHKGGDRDAEPPSIPFHRRRWRHGLNCQISFFPCKRTPVLNSATRARSISPLVGEMSGRTEGGNPTLKSTLELNRHKSNSPNQCHLTWTNLLPHTPIPPQRRANAKRMRHAMTEAELKLWNAIRAHRLMGLSFRRQVPIAGYIVDFACPSHRLIIEIDGSQHGNDKNQTYDQARTKRLEADGWTVIRFWNDDILKDIDNTCLHILTITELTTSGRAMA